ncbi:MAG: DNA helicase, partial [Deltaproteobacteria bacterium]|nr:DNA helicase [Deltaproteobacteria bacterium]
MVANQQTDGHLTDEDRALIREEEQFLERVQSAIRRAELGTADQTRMRQVHGRMVELRDEAARAAESDLPSLLEALHTHQALASRPTATELPDERSPYFAHMRLRENGRARDVLLGHRTFIDAKARITVIDWRHAPLSRIFYTYKEGEEYEEVLPGRVANGVMEMRRVITVQDGKLVRISTPDRTYRRNGGPEWIADAPQQAPQLQGGEGTATRGYTALGTGQGGRPAPEVSALLDEQQFNILNADDAAPMMILGGAGCGKTTVALHRMSALNYRNPERYKPERMLVVVPEEGLVRLSKKLLAGLHLSRVPVSTFDDWVARQARMLIRGLSRRRYDLTPPRVSRFKRHPAMLDVLPEFVAARHEQIANRLRRTLSEAKAQVDTFAADSEGPLVERLRRLERS